MNNRKHMLSQLTQHMLTKDRLESWLRIDCASAPAASAPVKSAPAPVNSAPVASRQEPAPITHVVIRQRDKLVWCMYIIVYGLDNYNDVQPKLFTTENDFKYASISKIREKQKLIKSAKLKMQDIESELISNKQINIPVLHALAIAYEKTIVFVHNRIYYEFPYGDTFFLIEKKKNDIMLHVNDQTNYISQIKTELYNIPNANKIIKGVSAYTAKELQDIAVKLQISTNDDETGKPLTKAKLYNEIAIKIEKLT